MRNNGKSVKAVLMAVLMAVLLSGCVDEKTGKPKPELPNNLGGVPIVQGLQEAAKLLP